MSPDAIQASSIVLNLEANTKDAAIRELIGKAEAFRCVTDIVDLEHSVLTKERATSTGFGRGVAISHGESPDIDHVAVALGLSETGIEFESLDGKPVYILFLVVNPVNQKAAYLDVLATLSGLLRNPEVRERLRCCTCVPDVEATLKEAMHIV